MKRTYQLALRWLLLGGLAGGIISGLMSVKGAIANAPSDTASLASQVTPLESMPPLRSVMPTFHTDEPLGWDGQLWGEGLHPVQADGYPPLIQAGDRAQLLLAIQYSLRYLQTPEAIEDYAEYEAMNISRDRVQRSLERFQELLLTARSAQELQRAVLAEFEFYQSIGNDGLGTVEFTGYFEPIYAASRTPTAEYRYPLYRRPSDLDGWPMPHPTRADLEGVDGLGGASGRLDGLELVWLRDRLEAFLVQVQGSARLQLTDGSIMTVGYAGRTEYEYTSLGRELVNDGKFSLDELTLPMVLDYFRTYPDELDRYLPRNNRFVFFRETGGSAPTGSLRVPVTADRSIATDKSLMPPGALALIQTQLPYVSSDGSIQQYPVNRYVLDQDTGGAIQGAGRVDVFLGTGITAGDRAGLVNTPGQLYYLLLRD